MIESYKVVHYSEEERLAAVQRYKILDTPPDATFDRITKLAARSFEMPIAFIGIVDRERIWIKSRYGLAVRQLTRKPELGEVIAHDDVYTVTDISIASGAIDPIGAELGLRSYAVAPISTADSYNLGTICVGDFSPRQFTDVEKDTLRDLATLTMEVLELRLKARKPEQLEAAKEVQLFERDSECMINTDILTGLKDRCAFDINLEWHALQANADGGDLAVVIIDLDGLEEASEIRGIEQEDLLLKSFASSLRSVFRNNDSAYRFSNSEFALLLPMKRKGDFESLKQIVQQRLMRAISHTRQGVLARVGASAGVAMLSESNGLLPEIVRLAEARMHVQKLERQCASQSH